MIHGSANGEMFRKKKSHKSSTILHFLSSLSKFVQIVPKFVKIETMDEIQVHNADMRVLFYFRSAYNSMDMSFHSSEHYIFNCPQK